jgi:uncharacterized protein
MPPTARRNVDPRYRLRATDEVSFADGFPVLVTVVESLAALNARLITRGQIPAEMQRFRPNVVLSGLAAWAEDNIDELYTEHAALALVKACSRCVMVNVDPNNGAYGAEPLRVLSTFRAHDQRVLFGENAVPLRTGRIAVGDAVRTTSRDLPAR